MELRRDNHRAAALEAATASELALRRLLDIRLDGVEDGIAKAISSNCREMGRLVDLLDDLGVVLPSDVKTKVLHVRNRAIHRGEEPSRDQVVALLGVASDLVERASPIRTLLSG